MAKMKLRGAQIAVLLTLREDKPFDYKVPRGYNLGWFAQTINALLRRGLIYREINKYFLTEKGRTVTLEHRWNSPDRRGRVNY